MKKLIFSFIYTLIFFTSAAQTDREFWFVAPEVTTTHDDFHTFGSKVYRGGEPVFLRISTMGLASTVTIDMPANSANFPPLTVNIAANSSYSINLTDYATNAQIENMYNTNGFNNKGIHITSTELITCYYEVAIPNNTDLFALKGKNALGKEFFTPFQTMSDNNTAWTLKAQAIALGEKYPVPAYSAIHIVATKDATKVEITPSKLTFDGKTPAVPYIITLNKGETYSLGPKSYIPGWYGGQKTFSYAAADRLAGTYIRASADIAVTISDDSMKFPSNGCYDLSGDQLIPTSIIGYEYIAMRGQISMNGRAVGKTGEQLYILATKDNTEIKVNGVVLGTINKGKQLMYEFDVADYAVHIASDDLHPFYVLHISGFGCEQGAAILPPTSACTGSTQIGFTRTTSDGFFLNLMVRKDAFDGFILNGKPILTKLSDWTAIPSDPVWLTARVDFTTNTAAIPTGKQSLILNTKDIFHMGIINGNKNGGCRFGYFSDFNKLEIKAITTFTQTANIRTCWGDPVRLQGIGGTNYHWTPHDFLDDPYSQNPLSMPRGNMKYTVSVSGACDMVGTADVTVEVAPKVEAIFTVDTVQACAPYPFTFYNLSTGATSENKWTFDDGSLPVNLSGSVITHEYTNATDTMQRHTIQLVTKNVESCRDTMTREIFVFPEISAQFVPSKLVGCSPVSVDFNNSSTGTRGLKPQLWEFGDGAASSLVGPTHLYENNTRQDTTFHVQLAVSNQYYCADTAVADILVHPYINADFAVSPIITCTPYSAEITDKSVGADSYRWSYGDTKTSTTSTTHIHDYINTTTATKVYPLVLIVDNTEGCSDTLSRNITVHPDIKALFNVNATTVCDNVELTFTNASTGANSYFWDFGDNATSAAKNPKHTFRNLTNATIKYKVRLIAMATNGVCSDTVEQEITVHPFLSAQYNFASAAGCSPFTVKLNNASVGASLNSWNMGDGQTNTYPDKTFDHIYINNTISAKTYTISLVTTNPQGCTQRMDKNITVYPSIDADFDMSATSVCDSTKVVFTNKSLGASTYEWRFGDLGASAKRDTSFTMTNPLNANAVKEIMLIARANNNVCTDTALKQLTVYPQVKALFSINSPTGCTPFTVNATDASIQASTYTWTLSNGTTINTKGSISQQFTNATNVPVDHTITLKVENSQNCSSTQTRKITVYPKVTAQFATTNGCSPHNITDFANTTINANTYEWDFGDNSGSNLKSPEHSFVNFSSTADQIFTVTLNATSEFGCKDKTTRTVTVFYAPNADFTIGNPRGCAPYDIDLTNNTKGAISYVWNYGDGRPTSTTSAAMHTITYTNSTRLIKTYPITLSATSSNACVSTLSRNVVIYPAITAEFETSNGCSPLTIADFKNTSVGAAKYDWTFGDGVESNELSPSHTFRNFSTIVDSVYTVKLLTTSPNGCTATSSATVTVYAKPDAAFEISNATGCSPYKVTLTNTSKGVNVYNWDMGDGLTRSDASANFEHEYFNSTRAIKYVPVVLIGSTVNGCSDTISRNAVIYPDIKAEFKAFSGCHPHTVGNFVNTSVGAASYSWDFGDKQTSNEANPSHKFVHFSDIKDTTYHIILTAKSVNECISTKDTIITVFHKPTAEFSIADNNGCSPHTTSIVNMAQGYKSLSWDFGDGEKTSIDLPTFDHKYSNSTVLSTVYPLTLIAVSDNNCSDTITYNVTVYPDISARFEAFSGCHPHTISDFKPKTVGANILYQWNFGNGQSSNLASPSQIFNNFSNTVDSVYKISLDVQSEYECKAHFDTTIRVYPKPKAEFLLVKPEGCAPYTVQVNNNSIGAKTLVWDFADGSAKESNTSAKLSHAYTNITGQSITFPVNVLATSTQGCTDTMSRNAIIHSQVIVNFEPVSGCHPHTIKDFKNTTVGTNLSYNWQFGDAQSSDLAKPVHLFSNISRTIDSVYSIKLYAESPFNCKDEKTIDITVYHKPLSEFSIDNTPGCSPYPVKFTNKSQGNSQSLWSFGDGIDSVADNKPVVHRYRNSTGEVFDYPVQLIAVTVNACSDTITRSAKIYPDITSAFKIEGGCHPLTIKDFQNTSQWADEYQWNFGDGGSSNLQKPEHTFRNFGRDKDSIYTVGLRTVSRYGCKADTSISITIKYKPKAEFAITNSPGCSPYIIEFKDQSIGADTSYWAFGDGSLQTETSISDVSHSYTHSEPNLKLYPTQLIAKTDGGCADTVVRSSTIYPTISSSFDAIQTSCTPYTTSFNNYSEGAFTYNWNLGNGNNSSEFEPNSTYFNHSYTRDTVYTVSLETFSKFGCRAYSEMDITVFPNPNALFSILNTPICSPDTIQMVNATEGADVMLWDFADGKTAIDSVTGSLSHTYRNADVDYKNFPIEMIAITNNGCGDTLTRVATVYPDISSQFNIAIKDCNPLKVDTYNTSIGAARYLWNMGDGATSGNKDLTHIFYNFDPSKDATFTMSLRTESKYGCTAFKDTVVTVYAVPIAEFSVEKDLACSPFSVAFTNKSKGGTFYAWNYADGSSIGNEKNPTHIFKNDSTDIIKRKVKLVVSNAHGCKDSVSKTISTYPEVTAQFEMDSTGCHPHYVEFDNQSRLGDLYVWKLGEKDERTGFEPFKYFENQETQTITHKVLLTATSRYGCWDTVSKLVTVYPSPDADFNVDPKKQVFPPSNIGKATVNITDLTNEGEWMYNWKFGDGTESDVVGNTSHDYSTWNVSGGYYLIELKVSNQYDCTDTASQKVVVTSPKPEPTFAISSDNGCPPYSVDFVDNSAYASKVRWYFGDGVESTERSTNHTYYNTGTYNVVFEIEGDGGVSTADTVVEIHQMPIIQFSVSNPLLTLPNDTLHLLNTSSFGIRYLWEMGDGSTSEEFSPSYYYPKPGDYDIKLTAWTEHDCTLDSIAKGAVTVQAPCGIEFPNAFTPDTKNIQNGTWQVNGVDNVKLINTNDIFFPAKLEEGIVGFHLEVYNKWGEMIFVSDDKHFGWNGYYRNECAKMDVYVWKLKADCADGREITKVGDVTLVR